jgi:hypothetical protein
MFDEKEKRHSATLRKRTTSNPNVATAINEKDATDNSETVKSGNVQEGVCIIDQIGKPDYTGWMRKKADRYNSWKMRYFILKGPHLYFLRSNNASVSCALLFF